MDCGMVDMNTTLSHHLFQSSKAEIVGKVPADTKQDHRAIKMMVLERRTPPKATSLHALPAITE